jgi:hypothetical protein
MIRSGGVLDNGFEVVAAAGACPTAWSTSASRPTHTSHAHPRLLLARFEREREREILRDSTWAQHSCEIAPGYCLPWERMRGEANGELPRSHCAPPPLAFACGIIDGIQDLIHHVEKSIESTSSHRIRAKHRRNQVTKSHGVLALATSPDSRTMAS